MKNKIPFILICFFLVFGCNSLSNKNNTINNTNSSIIKINTSEWNVNNAIPENIIKKVNFIPLETNDTCLLNGIGKLLVSDDKWYIMDALFSKAIYIFNKEGRFLNSIGKYGRGAGEYSKISDFTIDLKNNLLLILDSSTRKIFHYNLNNGKFEKETKLPFYATNFTILHNGILAFFLPNLSSKTREGFSIIYWNTKSNEQKYFLEKNEYDINLNSGHTIYESSKIYYCSYLNDVIYQLTDNNLTPAILLDYGNCKIPERMLEKSRKNGDDGILEIRKMGKWTFGINNIIENSQFISFTIRLKGKPIKAIYCKQTGNTVYGQFSGILNFFPLMDNYNISCSGDKFQGYINAMDFIRLGKKSITNNKQNDSLFVKILKKIELNSNPIIISLELNQF